MNFMPAAHRLNRARPGLALLGMIDVIFLLLIYFILTTTYARPEAELTSALQTQREAAGRLSDLTPQVIEVSRSGAGAVRYTVGGRVFESRSALLELLRVLPREAGIVVRGSDRALAEDAFAALQACRDAGFDRVTYVPAR